VALANWLASIDRVRSHENSSKNNPPSTGLPTGACPRHH
jgi:hypothetical protein